MLVTLARVSVGVKLGSVISVGDGVRGATGVKVALLVAETLCVGVSVPEGSGVNDGVMVALLAGGAVVGLAVTVGSGALRRNISPTRSAAVSCPSPLVSPAPGEQGFPRKITSATAARSA